MTAKQVFEAVLMELNKQNAPSIDLETFNYFFNKAINQFINKQFNVGVDTDQQRTDDIRVLKTSAILKPVKTPADLSEVITKLLGKTDGDNGKKGDAEVVSSDSVYGATYEFNLPADYLHLLNCICIYQVKKRINCPYNVGDIVRKGAIKCNADTWPLIIDNLYMRPTYKRPYYYINNLNTSPTNPTNPFEADINSGSSIQYSGTDVATSQYVETGPSYGDGKNEISGTTYKNTQDASAAASGNPLNRKYKISIDDVDSEDNTVVKTAGHRYGNSSNVRLEIRYGQDSSVFNLIGISIDYIKAPQFIRLTQEQLDLNEDTSQVIEFPDYICQEIINELTKIVMENASDPRLQTNPAISQSIAAPAQAQTSTKK